MNKIQTLNKIDTEGLKGFPLENYEIASEIPNPDAIILRSFKMHDMELPNSLQAIARAGAGVNNIPIDKCTDKGVVVFNTPGANANAVKELAIAALLMASRDITGGIDWAQTLIGKGSEVPALIEKGKSNFGGNEIQGKTLAIIGLGAIGVLIANAANALGMKVIGYDPYISVEHAWDLDHNIERAEGIEGLLANADFISLNIPLMDETKGYINKDKFVMMKDGVKILNMARGGLVNNEDIKAALASGKVAKYITDFPDEEMIKTDGVIAIPHLGASTAESETNCAIMAVAQTKDYLEDGNIKNSVNFPAAEMARNSGNRILIANKNVPNMVGQISTVLADAGINIANMLNRHRGDIAYNIIDVDVKNAGDDIVNKLKEIEGVIMVRVLAAKA